MKLAQAQENYELAGIRFAQSGYGGWMNYNTFDIGYARGTGAGLERVPFTWRWPVPPATTRDRAPREARPGRASCLAGPTSRGKDPLHGDARIVYDLGRNALDATFTDIYNLDTVQRHVVPEMRWSGVSVNSDGSFRQHVSSVNSIIGRFYGPGHAEVHCVFHHPTAIGAFGAKR